MLLLLATHSFPFGMFIHSSEAARPGSFRGRPFCGPLMGFVNKYGRLVRRGGLRRGGRKKDENDEEKKKRARPPFKDYQSPVSKKT